MHVGTLFLWVRDLNWAIVGTHPSGLVENEADEERRQFVTSDLQCACARNGHEALCACLAHTPDAVLTQVVKLWQLQQQNNMGLIHKLCTHDHHRKDTKFPPWRLMMHPKSCLHITLFIPYLSAPPLIFFTFCNVMCEHHHRNTFNSF